jgi:hypothetical protein
VTEYLYHSILQARKIDDENSAMNKDSKPKGKKGKKGSESENKLVDVNSGNAASELVVGAGSNEFTADASRSIFGNEPTTSGPAALKLPEAESEVRIGDRLLSKVEVDKMDSVIAAATANAESVERDVEMRVPKSDPLKQVIGTPLALATLLTVTGHEYPIIRLLFASMISFSPLSAASILSLGRQS